MHQAMLFSGFLYTDRDNYHKALLALQARFGEVLMESAELTWNYTSYYRDELGEGIIRRFAFFKDPIYQGDIADIKQFTIGVEKELAVSGKRTVNIDPGYMTSAKIVLATTKDYSHRIYLKDNIFAEVTLMYVKGFYEGHRFTYPDFLTTNYQNIFQIARKLLPATIA